MDFTDGGCLESSPDSLATFSNGELFFNRELNWLEFNYKVLLEATDRKNPLLERVKFLAIFYNNLDEFFMVRVAGLTRNYKLGIPHLSIDGQRPLNQIMAIRRRVKHLMAQAVDLWRKVLKPELFAHGLKVLSYPNLSADEKNYLQDFFVKNVLPILTPQALDKGRPFPLVSGESLNFFIELKNSGDKSFFARLKVPDNLPRFVCLPADLKSVNKRHSRPKSLKILPIEALIGQHLEDLFQGYKVHDHTVFRITRNTDIEIEEDEAHDLLAAVRDVIEQRRFGEVIKLETPFDTSKQLLEQLMTRFELEKFQHYTVKGFLAGSGLMSIASLDYPNLKFEPIKAKKPTVLKKGRSILKQLDQKDLFLYHPYDSFSPVLDFIKEATSDPKVKSIKQTLYRTGNDSTIIDNLIKARQSGKQVTAVVELKARFDETRNINWARALEEAGINIVYGLVGMKIHAKLCLVVRQQEEGLKSYVHIGTGNYNPITARQYTDFSLFTANQDIGREVVTLFNVMTGLSNVSDYKYLLVSPVSTRCEIIKRIEREVERHRQHGDGFIAFKLNQLSDSQIIKSLYRASQAGVRLNLQVRGICCLRPGVKNLSETITVNSLVGRFLEHSRILYFKNGDQSEVFIGSADLMPRNLDRRIEVLAPVLDNDLKEVIINEILKPSLADNCHTHQLLPDGSYKKNTPGKETIDFQAQMINRATGWIGVGRQNGPGLTANRAKDVAK